MQPIYGVDERGMKCTNAEPGTFNHECGRPAQWVGVKTSGFRAAFCDDCRRNGWERHSFAWFDPIGWHCVGGWTPQQALRHHVTGAIERGEAEPIVAID